MTIEAHSEPGAGAAKAPWEPPRITCVGKVRDLVRGQGKLSGELDGDAGSVRKASGLS